MKLTFRIAIFKILALSLLLFSFLPNSLGQSTSHEIKATFKKQIFKRSIYCSDKLPVPRLIETPFIGLSGYIETPELDAPIFYRTQSSENWSDWQELRKFDEQRVESRITFEGNPLEETTEFIQFKSHQKIDLPLMVRLFYPGHSKKKSNR